MLDFDGEARNGILNMPLIGAVAFVVWGLEFIWKLWFNLLVDSNGYNWGVFFSGKKYDRIPSMLCPGKAMIGFFLNW
jgi:hypothetical protein